MKNLITQSMIDEEANLDNSQQNDDNFFINMKNEDADDKVRFNRLEDLLNKSKFYSDFLLTKIDNVNHKKKKVHNNSHKFHSTYFTGGKLKDYQEDGVEWLKILYENGINGILADEMGLGKTIQCIAFLSHLIENNVKGPYIVIAPLSTIPNWVKEFYRFAPKLSVVLYHGKQDEREALRPIFTKINKHTQSYPIIVTSYDIAIMDHTFLEKFNWMYLIIDEGHRIKNYKCKLFSILKRFNSANRLLLTGTPLQNNLSELWALLNFLVPEIFDDLTLFMSWFDISQLCHNIKNHPTTNGFVIREKEKKFVNMLHQILSPFLLRRTKMDVDLNIPPKKEIVVYSPLSEFYQAQMYKAILRKDTNDICLALRNHFLAKYHDTAIRDSNKRRCPPRRNSSSDRRSQPPPNFTHNKSAPNKREQHMDDGDISVGYNPEVRYNGLPNGARDNINGADESPGFRNKRKSRQENFEKIYDIENAKNLDDWERLTQNFTSQSSKEKKRKNGEIKESDSVIKFGRLPTITLTNVYMRLRQCCNHPYLIDHLFEYPVDEDLINICGKMIILDQILPRLIQEKHKVLLFSQMTSVLDVLEDYCELRQINYVRLDGRTPLLKRKEDIDMFQTPTNQLKPIKNLLCFDSEDEDEYFDAEKAAINVFLISTRAGGLGINLSLANAVIIFDSDWNPQSDLQAQDRCHRIGQKEPVIVYRLVTEGTIDEGMVDRAFAKKKLEKMIIPKEKFKDSVANLSFSKTNIPYTLPELMQLLETKEFESLYKSKVESRDDGTGGAKNHHNLNNQLKLTESELQSLLDWESIFSEFYASHPKELKYLHKTHPRIHYNNGTEFDSPNTSLERKSRSRSKKPNKIDAPSHSQQTGQRFERKVFKILPDQPITPLTDLSNKA